MDKSGEGAVKFPFFKLMHPVLKDSPLASQASYVIDTQEPVHLIESSEETSMNICSVINLIERKHIRCLLSLFFCQKNNLH